jgi:hypothetical protein
MDEIKLLKAIKKLKPTAEFSFNDADYSTIKWDVLDGDAPTQTEINKAIKEIDADEIAEAKAKEAQRQAILDRIGLTSDELKTILG